MVARNRVIFTRSSRAASSGGEGARICTAAAGCAIGVGAAAARSIAAIMSPLVTRPSLPEPGTVAVSIPLSAASLRTDGGTGMAAGCGLGAAGAARLASAGLAAAALDCAGAAAVGFAQRLLARTDGSGVVLAPEVLVASQSVREAIKRPENNPPIKSLMEKGVHPYGMQTFQMCIQRLLDQGLIDRNRLAGFFEPFANRRLGDRFAERGDADVHHDQYPFSSRPD